MKKVSTVAVKQSRNISQQKLTIGLDLGDRNSWYCVLDEAGQIQLEQRVHTTAKALQEVFGAMPRSRIALEIGTHSPVLTFFIAGLLYLLCLEHVDNLGAYTASRPETGLPGRIPRMSGIDFYFSYISRNFRRSMPCLCPPLSARPVRPPRR